MAASWPGQVRTYTSKNDDEVIYGAHMNAVQEEIVALETYVGSNPHVDSSGFSDVFGTKTFQSVASRLNASSRYWNLKYARWTFPGVLAVQQGKLRITFYQVIRLYQIWLVVAEPPTGSAITADLNGVSNYSTWAMSSVFPDQTRRPTIAAGSRRSSNETSLLNYAYDPANPTQQHFNAGATFTVDIDSVGSTFPGADLTVEMSYWHSIAG